MVRYLAFDYFSMPKARGQRRRTYRGGVRFSSFPAQLINISQASLSSIHHPIIIILQPIVASNYREGSTLKVGICVSTSSFTHQKFQNESDAIFIWKASTDNIFHAQHSTESFGTSRTNDFASAPPNSENAILYFFWYEMLLSRSIHNCKERITFLSD